MILNHKLLNQAFKNIPEEVQEVMLSEDTTQKIIDIGKKYNLHIDQTGIVSGHIGMLMVGLLKPKDFIPELSGELKMSVEQIRPIAQEVNEKILAPIREALKKIHGLDGSTPLNEEVMAKTPAKPASPSANFDDRLGKYLSTTKPSEDNTLSPRPYTQDPYRESME